MTLIYFKTEYTIRGLSLVDEQPILVEFGGTRSIRVVMQHHPLEQAGERKYTGNSQVLATAACEVDHELESVFHAIDDNKVMGKNSRYAVQYGNERGQTVQVPFYDELPDALTELVISVKDDLGKAAKRAGIALRRRLGHYCPPRPFSASGMHWSFDNRFWHPLPLMLTASVSGGSVVHITQLARTQISEIAVSESEEPVHRVLFLEAWEQRLTNSASALVMGVASVEIGLKWLIATLVPNAEWLAMESPAPPVLRILREYVPTLPVRLSFNGHVPTLPSPVLTHIKDAVEQRNHMAHTGELLSRPLRLEAKLRAIEDCLWLCEYYAGTSWALEHISPKTLEALQGASSRQ